MRGSWSQPTEPQSGRRRTVPPRALTVEAKLLKAKPTVRETTNKMPSLRTQRLTLLKETWRRL